MNDPMDLVSRKVTFPKLKEVWDLLGDEEDEDSDVIYKEVPVPKKKRFDDGNDPSPGSGSMSFTSRLVLVKHT